MNKLHGHGSYNYWHISVIAQEKQIPRAVETAGRVECSLCKQHLNIPHPLQRCMRSHASVILQLQGQRQDGFWDSLPDRLDKLMIPRFSERCCLKNNVESDWGRLTSCWPWSPHTCMHTHKRRAFMPDTFSATLVPGDLTPSFDLCWHQACMRGTHIHARHS